MTFALVGTLVLLLGGIVFFFLKSQKRASPPPAVAASRAARPSVVPPAATATPTPVLAESPRAAAPMPTELPPALRDFEWKHPEQLNDIDRQALLERLQHIPRPSRTLHKLVSPDFIQNASSIELGELVLGEPHIAAKVLSTVNSPLYGLQRPVASIGQGITFLGLHTVRGLCLQYMLNDSFKPAQPEIKKLFDMLWGASAIASELCHRLAQKLNIPDSGAMVTQVVLSFLGHMAALSLLPPQLALATREQTLLDRLRTQQEQLGLNAVEIGRVLLQDWALPESIVNDVAAIDGVLVHPASAQADAREIRLALCYLSARLGEKLAFGQIQDLSCYEPQQDESMDLRSVQACLQSPRLSRLTEMLHAPDVCNTVHQMTAHLRNS